MRIIAGEFRGRTLTAPSDNRLRPTSDRVREAAFNILAYGVPGFQLAGARVLDLFAGSGALGLEALSRGAASALFVEIDAGARGAIRTNVEALGLTGKTRIFRRDATSLGPVGQNGQFSLVLLDPPYNEGLAPRALQSAMLGRWLMPGAVIVAEEHAGANIDLPDGLTLEDRRTYGGTQLIVARFGNHDLTLGNT